MVTDVDIGWLCGIIDGEGTTTIRMKIRETKNYGKRPRFWTEVSIVNTDLNLIEKLSKILSELNIHYRINVRDRKTIPNSKPITVITISAKGIRLLIPHMKLYGIKAKEFEILEKAIILGEENQKRGGNKSGLKGKSPMPDSVLKKFDMLRMELVGLHGRQAANLIKLRAQDYNLINI